MKRIGILLSFLLALALLTACGGDDPTEEPKPDAQKIFYFGTDPAPDAGLPLSFLAFDTPELPDCPDFSAVSPEEAWKVDLEWDRTAMEGGSDLSHALPPLLTASLAFQNGAAQGTVLAEWQEQPPTRVDLNGSLRKGWYVEAPELLNAPVYFTNRFLISLLSEEDETKKDNEENPEDKWLETVRLAETAVNLPGQLTEWAKTYGSAIDKGAWREWIPRDFTFSGNIEVSTASPGELYGKTIETPTETECFEVTLNREEIRSLIGSIAERAGQDPALKAALEALQPIMTRNPVSILKEKLDSTEETPVTLTIRRYFRQEQDVMTEMVWENGDHSEENFTLTLWDIAVNSARQCGWRLTDAQDRTVECSGYATATEAHFDGKAIGWERFPITLHGDIQDRTLRLSIVCHREEDIRIGIQLGREGMEGTLYIAKETAVSADMNFRLSVEEQVPTCAIFGTVGEEQYPLTMYIRLLSRTENERPAVNVTIHTQIEGLVRNDMRITVTRDPAIRVEEKEPNAKECLILNSENQLFYLLLILNPNLIGWLSGSK